MLTLITQIFGIKGKYGALCIEPKLSIDYFNEEGISEISTIFSGRNINVVFVNKNHLDFGSYSIKDIAVNGSKISVLNSSTDNKVVLDNFKELLDKPENSIIITLE